MQFPKSCDTFVVLPPLTKKNVVIFGKNSDRPQNEVQEVIFITGGIKNHQLKCTYISIDESNKPLNNVILSKPAWMWGAEMGANDKNVVIGNEAVWTDNNEGDADARQKRLLGMDLVRLGLERGNTAAEALDVITSLLEEYGQGGPCSEFEECLYYHNSFLIADPNEAWVLETSGKMWVAEKIENGYRNISNGLTITTKIDKHSKNIKEKALEMGQWDGKCEFNFTQCFSSGGDEDRQKAGEKLLANNSANYQFDVKNMFNILRHKESRICRSCDDSFPTQGSQVSILSQESPSIHWFTATPDPSVSFFKPFIFIKNAVGSEYTVSPNEAKREHHLYKLHMKHVGKSNNNKISDVLRKVEEECLQDINNLLEKHDKKTSFEGMDDLFKKYVDKEMKLYN